jgi:hypothetical protein
MRDIVLLSTIARCNRAISSSMARVRNRQCLCWCEACHEKRSSCATNENESLCARDTQSRALPVAELRTLMRVFFLTIFFIDSIQLTNCDDVHVAMFHDKWKGRIEPWQLKRLQRRLRRPRRKRSTNGTSTELKGTRKRPFWFLGSVHRDCLCGERTRQRFFLGGADAVVGTPEAT